MCVPIYQWYLSNYASWIRLNRIKHSSRRDYPAHYVQVAADTRLRAAPYLGAVKAEVTRMIVSEPDLWLPSTHRQALEHILPLGCSSFSTRALASLCSRSCTKSIGRNIRTGKRLAMFCLLNVGAAFGWPFFVKSWLAPWAAFEAAVRADAIRKLADVRRQVE
jgi:hypothetical protein